MVELVLARIGRHRGEESAVELSLDVNMSTMQ